MVCKQDPLPDDQAEGLVKKGVARLPLRSKKCQVAVTVTVAV